MHKWNERQVKIKFQLGDNTLFSSNLQLQVREVELDDETHSVGEPMPPTDTLPMGNQGFLIRSLHISKEQPTLRFNQNYICYVANQYQRYFIDMRQSFTEYKDKFSSKTRSTINRKVKKYAEYCGGDISWKIYRAADEMLDFFQLARSVSEKTYQEKLLGAGLPNSKEFLMEMEKLARKGKVRGFILFYNVQPVAYLYCPISNGVLIYAFLGYDPKYMSFSVGTVLQWLALESLFEERCFSFFDFTEGQSDHKKLFATDSVRCANVFFLRKNLGNLFLLQSHRAVNYFSKLIGDKLDQLGVKAKIKKLMRFGI
jgi:CelD/BcsL family acetyltransferase involved in cellulose biosynthesis